MGPQNHYEIGDPGSPIPKINFMTPVHSVINFVGAPDLLWLVWSGDETIQLVFFFDYGKMNH